VSDTSAHQLVFSYGDLQRPEVQRDLFGRVIPGEADLLPGYTVDYAEVEDHRVDDSSAPAVRPVVRETGDPRDKVVGKAMMFSEDELDAADEFEASLYSRRRVTLASGRRAWVYVGS
jgi:hypothetical protein